VQCSVVINMSYITGDTIQCSSAIRELPRVLSIYDIDIPIKDARAAVEFHFRQNEHLRDPRCVLVEH
jgi:hypothetical protein